MQQKRNFRGRLFFRSPNRKTSSLGGSLLTDYTRRVGFDTIRLNWDMGSDLTVYRFPAEHEWYGDKPLSYPKEVDPLQTVMQMKCVEVDAYGGGMVNLKNGGRLLWRRQDGVFYELRRGQYQNLLSLECSFPKLLYGHNRSPVPPEVLPDALEELTRRGRAFIRDLPPCDELDAWRIDATSDVMLRSELEVGLVGRVLADCHLNGVFPTREPSGGSVAWAASNGFPRSICYGKFAESGHERAVGQYRSEVHVRGGKQFRKALEFAVERGDLSPDFIAGKGKRCVRVGTLATEKNVCTSLLGALNGVLDSAIGLVREVNAVTALEAIDLLELKAGVKRARAAQLVGYAHIVRVLGWSFTGLDRSNVWRAKEEFKKAGVDPTQIEFSSAEKIGAGAGMVIGGAVLAGVVVAGAVAGDALGKALMPDVPKTESVAFVEPGPVPAKEIANVVPAAPDGTTDDGTSPVGRRREKPVGSG